MGLGLKQRSLAAASWLGQSYSKAVDENVSYPSAYWTGSCWCNTLVLVGGRADMMESPVATSYPKTASYMLQKWAGFATSDGPMTRSH